MSRARQGTPTAGAPLRPPPGKHVMPALDGSPNKLEAAVLDGLDADRLHQLAECLFTLNNRRFGPIPGAYVVMCVEPGKRWCVGQLSADRSRPVLLFEDLAFDDPAAAQEAAGKLRESRGEAPPMRSL